MDAKYHEAVMNYYDLKRKYDKREQRRRSRDLAPLNRCISCKKSGGTLFTIQKNVIKAICGAKKKCKLHIEIELAKYKNMSEEIETIGKYLENLMQEIIQTKLDLIFGFKNDNKFNALKKNYEKQNEYLINLKKKLEKDHFESEGRKELNQFIDEYKSIIKEYMSNQNSKLLSEALDLYLEKIIPIQEQIRKETYTNMSIERDNKKYILMQEKELHKDILMEKGRIISNIT